MAIMDLAVSNPRFAQGAARLLNTFDLDPLSAEISNAMFAFTDGAFNERFSNDANWPVKWGYATTQDTLLFFLSGWRDPSVLQDVVTGYLNPSNDILARPVHGGFLRWARNILARIAVRRVPRKPKIVIIAHSLGSAIGAEILGEYDADGVQRFALCTFGAPKSTFIGSDERYMKETEHAGWETPNDNVPSLPPTSAAAPLLYAALTVAQRDTLVRWKPLLPELGLEEDGSVTRLPAHLNLPIRLSSLLAVYRSRAGLFGVGHGLEVYLGSLIAACVRYNVPPAVADPIPPVGNVPVVQVPAVAFPRVVVPAVPAPAIFQERIVAFREDQAVREAQPSIIPFPNRVSARRFEGLWYVEWMGSLICICPTKKKARALARHLNRFLPLFQTVGQSYSNNFVSALHDYLAAARDPSQAYRPILDDGGDPPSLLLS